MRMIKFAADLLVDVAKECEARSFASQEKKKEFLNKIAAELTDIIEILVEQEANARII